VATAVRSITKSADSVKTLVDEVKLGSQEQSRGIEQVAKAVVQMQKVTQSTAANAEESASASQELSAQSDTLRALILRLHGMVGGGSGAGASSRLLDGKRTTRPAVGMRSHSPAPRRGSAEHAGKPTAVAVGTADKDAFPLDEDFKEF
jgi:methyl-accepting chemotaxis protein/methyl-accepting chemotaxis protein-1 (serine sensor receptor)